MIGATREAERIVEMASGPFHPGELAAALSRIDPEIGAAIEGVCAMRCVSLKDGTGRVVLSKKP